MALRRFLCIFFAAAMLTAAFGCAAAPEDRSYQQGKSALASGRLAEAAEHFGPLGDYRDCRQQLQFIFDRALELYHSEEYTQSAAVFLALAAHEFPEARSYAAACQALACLEVLNGPGARAALAEGDAASQPITEATALADRILFPGTAIVRPEYAARELASGELSAEIKQIAPNPNPEYLYAMDRQASQRVYQQYRDYCKAAFPDSFRDESENYFSFRAEGVLCYVSNFHSVDAGMVVLISAL